LRLSPTGPAFTEEARRFLNKLRATLEYLDVFDGEREGSIRVDANISLKGHSRVECKNISSYKGVEKALNFEVTRQKNMLRRGAEIVMETRHFQEGKGITTSSRSKEKESDYRYFPEPDLRPLRVRDWVDTIELPELPDARRERFVKQYGISLNHARTLTGDIRVANFYEQVAGDQSVLCATLVSDTLLGELNYRSMKIADVQEIICESDAALASRNHHRPVGVDLLREFLDGSLEGATMARPSEIVTKRGLTKAGDDEFAEIMIRVIDANPQAVSDYQSGNAGAVNFLVGQVMKETRGRADPITLGALLKAQLEERET